MRGGAIHAGQALPSSSLPSESGAGQIYRMEKRAVGETDSEERAKVEICRPS